VKLFNIIIPSIKNDQRLKRCLDGIQKQSFKDFFVTLVLDENKKLENLKKYNFEIKVLINKNKINMSTKRNWAANKFKSLFLAFIDSDAYPSQNWLKNSEYIIKKKIECFGGPNIPFRKSSYSQKISYYCKRSFFVTAHYNFIKYLSANRHCQWLDSSNMIINRKRFLSINGMNKNLYIGEDHDFFFRLKKKFPNLLIFFFKKIYVFHEDREIQYYFFQRFCYGLNVFTSKNTLAKRVLALIPAISILFFINYFFILSIKFFFVLILSSFMLISVFIYLEIKKYIKNNIDRFIVILAIFLCNLFYGLGTISYFFCLRNLIEKKIYRKIKKNLK
jgi:glycosyltransferase involved in cell wall biosynthesis